MKAAPFRYHRPGTKSDVVALLGELENARLLAGGQSLVAMLNMRYAIVDHLIDINRVSELSGIEFDNQGAVRIGAMTRQHIVLEHPELTRRVPVFAEALKFVGHLQTRNRGTVGGSIAHMDPAAELMGLASLLEATVHVQSRTGSRDIAIADYPLSYLTPNLEPHELLTAVTFRVPAAGHGWSFTEFAQRHGDFAIVGIGAILELAADRQTITRARLTAIGLGAAPRRLTDAEDLLAGQRPSADLFRAAGAIAEQSEAMEDAAASSRYRQRLAGVLSRRSLAAAMERAKERAAT